MSESLNYSEPVLVTGATGYVGGRLIPQLLEKGYRVRAMGRSLDKLKNRPWAGMANLEFVVGDVLDKPSLERACIGCSVVFYLVHSMLPEQKDFSETDRTAACNMRSAAQSAGVQRIIYLSGLGEDNPALSKHLRSRAEVGLLLREGPVPVTVLRAAMIIGSGSASFEILRYLVDRLPVMVTPRWLETPNQPVAIRNVINYLAGCLEHPETAGQTYDVGGSEIVTYRELLEIYAEEAGLPKRLVIPVPVLTPRLSSYWIHLVTPVPAAIARPLAEGLRNRVICQDHRIESVIPQKLLSPREAIRAALDATGAGRIKSHWTDAGRIPPVEAVYAGDPKWSGGTVLRDHREKKCSLSRAAVWQAIVRIGGKNGWYYANALWEMRGFLDKLFGGVGLRRGRRSESELATGDALDFWRVLSVIAEQRLLLLAEMKLPGRATLEFRIEAEGGGIKVMQTALFKPKGLWGIVYWYILLPFHFFIFSGMLNQIIKRAERFERQTA